jgi:hypothetical protein
VILTLKNPAGIVGQSQQITENLTQNTVAAPLGPVQKNILYVYAITQDATGGWTYTFPENVQGATPPSTDANKTTIQIFVSFDGLTLVPVSAATFV